MPNRLLTGIFLICIFNIAFQSLADEPSPRLEVDQSEYEFGQAIEGRSIDHTFVLTNTGDADLVIERIKPACGCTSARQIENVTLRPAESLELPVSLSLKGRSGGQHKSVTIYSNDPGNRELKVWMKGEVIRPIQMEPASLALGRFDIEAKPSASVQLIAADGRQFMIEAVVASSSLIEASFEEVVAGEVYRVNIQVNGALPEGQIAQTLTIKTSDPDAPTLTVPIMGHVMSDFAVAPRELVLLSSSATSTRYIMIGPGAIQSFEITDVEVPDDQITATILKAGKQGYRVRLSNVPSDSTLDGKLVTLTTNNEVRPTITVPIRVISTELEHIGTPE